MMVTTFGDLTESVHAKRERYGDKWTENMYQAYAEARVRWKRSKAKDAQIMATLRAGPRHKKPCKKCEEAAQKRFKAKHV